MVVIAYILMIVFFLSMVSALFEDNNTLDKVANIAMMIASMMLFHQYILLATSCASLSPQNHNLSICTCVQEHPCPPLSDEGLTKLIER